MDGNNPIEYPIDGILDLHTFRPNEVKDLIPEYLAACRERGILQVRIIHGKGTGIPAADRSGHPVAPARSLFVSNGRRRSRRLGGDHRHLKISVKICLIQKNRTQFFCDPKSIFPDPLTYHRHLFILKFFRTRILDQPNGIIVINGEIDHGP